MSPQSSLNLSSILEHSPNGIVLVDDQARIQFVNPAFRKMFSTSEEDLAGRRVSELLRSDCFDRAIASDAGLSVRGKAPEHDLYYRASLFRIEGESWWCGIFIDTSEEEQAREELQKVRQETLARAEKVIHRQMQTAQEIAGLLGETTAETKVLLAKLMDLFRREEKP